MINEHDIEDMKEQWRLSKAYKDIMDKPYETYDPVQALKNYVYPAQVQKKKEANDVQVGGNHYKKYGNLQPWDVITAWGLGYLDGTALKYIARWRDKGGIDDIRKAIHFLEKFIEVEEAKKNV